VGAQAAEEGEEEVTLLPHEGWNVAGVEGDRYTVGPFCDAPGCKRPVDHKHHLWRRSYIGGDRWWVRVPGKDGRTLTIRNVVGLCWRHHEEVTGSVGGHKAWIRWLEDEEALYWLELDPDDHWQAIGTLSLPAPSRDVAPSSPGREAERCPSCGRLRTTPHDHEPQPKRPRKTWTVRVPADQEDGAAILDELLDGCAEIFGHEEYTSGLRRYYTLVQGLALLLQNRELIAAQVDSDA
jgi:hypothetical protein